MCAAQQRIEGPLFLIGQRTGKCSALNQNNPLEARPLIGPAIQQPSSILIGCCALLAHAGQSKFPVTYHYYYGNRTVTNLLLAALHLSISRSLLPPLSRTSSGLPYSLRRPPRRGRRLCSLIARFVHHFHFPQFLSNRKRPAGVDAQFEQQQQQKNWWGAPTVK
jgi:hypothetical protein